MTKIVWVLAAMLGLFFCVDAIRGFGREKTKATPRSPTTVTLSPKESSFDSAPDRSADEPRAVVIRKAPPVGPEASTEASGPSDRSVVLSRHFEAAPPPTRATREKETEFNSFMEDIDLGDLGSVQDVSCRGDICRGVFDIAGNEADNEFFTRTILSAKYAEKFPQAFSISERKVTQEGRVLATFYMHPQELFHDIPQGDEEEEREN